MLGLTCRRLLLCTALPLCACGDDASTNRPPDAGTTTVGPTTVPSTTVPSTSASDAADGSGTGDSSGSDTGATDEADTSGDPAFCPDTHRCIEEAPEGWGGPGMALRADAEARPPACDDLYPDDGVLGFDDLVAPEAACACDCGEANGSTCANNTVLRYWGDAAECNEGAATQVTLFTVVCNNLPSPFPGDRYWQIDVIEASGGACSPQDEESIEDPTWATRVATCEGAELLGGCAPGRVCAPEPADADAQLCIWRTGEHACPEGYEDAQTIFTEVNDSRGCAPCSCSEPVGVCDEAQVTMTQNFNCGVPIANTFPADGECKDASSIDVRAALLTTGTPSAFCTPSDPMPVGEAIGAEPITVCCDA